MWSSTHMDFWNRWWNRLKNRLDGFLINFNESFITSMCHNPHFLYDFPMFNSINGQAR